MKKYILLFLFILPLGLSAQTDVLRWSGDTLYVNTTTLCPTVKGYNGTTPVEIRIYDGKVVGVRALPNRETRSYFRVVNNALMNKWNGQTISRAITLDVDAVSGATMSSRSIIANVRAGLTEAQKEIPDNSKEGHPTLLFILGAVLLVCLVTLLLSVFKKRKQK